MTGPSARLCLEVRRCLLSHARGELGRVRTRVLDAHLRRCEACTFEQVQQLELAEGLRTLSEPVLTAPVEVPDGLLADLLAATDQAGISARAAVPLRGAVSGARPMLTLLLLAGGAAVGSAAGYGVWKLLGRSRTTRR